MKREMMNFYIVVIMHILFVRKEHEIYTVICFSLCGCVRKSGKSSEILGK